MKAFQNRLRYLYFRSIMNQQQQETAAVGSLYALEAFVLRGKDNETGGFGSR